MSLENVTSGLAAVVAVDLRTERRDLGDEIALANTDGPEGLANPVNGIGPLGDEGLDLGGPGIGGEVEILVLAIQERIAHRSADEVQAVSGRGEEGSQLEGGTTRLHQPTKPGWGHGQRISGGSGMS